MQRFLQKKQNRKQSFDIGKSNRVYAIFVPSNLKKNDKNTDSVGFLSTLAESQIYEKS